MAFFAYEFDDAAAAKRIERSMRAKLRAPVPDMRARLLQPYIGTAKVFMQPKGQAVLIASMTPTFPRFYWLGAIVTLFALVIGLAFGNLGNWHLIIMALGLLWFIGVYGLWSNDWYGFVAKMRIKRERAEGVTRRLKDNEIVELLLKEVKAW